MTVFAQNTVQMESAFMMKQPTVLKTGTLPTKHLQKDLKNLWAIQIITICGCKVSGTFP